jgi:hypothetical protein
VNINTKKSRYTMVVHEAMGVNDFQFLSRTRVQVPGFVSYFRHTGVDTANE